MKRLLQEVTWEELSGQEDLGKREEIRENVKNLLTNARKGTKKTKRRKERKQKRIRET